MIALRGVMQLGVCALPFESVSTAALDLDFTRDPFDRLITAQASVAGAALVTKDRSIREAYAPAIWD